MSNDLKSLQADAPSVQPALLPDGSALTCFIVDDEPAIQNLLAGALAPFGCKPECYKSAQGVLVALKRMRPHLVFLDVSLEGSDAIDVIRGLSEAKFSGRVQLISGKDPQTLRDLQLIGERHSLSMLPPLQKPFRINAVRQIVQDNLAELRPARKFPQQPVDLSYQKLRLGRRAEEQLVPALVPAENRYPENETGRRRGAGALRSSGIRSRLSQRPFFPGPTMRLSPSSASVC